MTMERIIRPFQLAEVFTARVLPPSKQPDVTVPEDIVQVWGKGNDTNYDRFALSGIIGGVVHFTEKERTTRTVRYFNPEESEDLPDEQRQYLDVQQIKTMRMTSDQDASDIRFVFNNPGFPGAKILVP